ncbi:MAG TPA: hypothetical protein VGB56_12940 [Flavisolibacter sp.]
MTRSILLCVVAFFLTASLNAQFTMTLRKSFIDSFKNRITISSDFEVYYAHERPNPPNKDGDLHVAGYDSVIGLPVVAELMNAAGEPFALSLVQDAAGEGRPQKKIKMSGAWRLWSEHIGRGDHYFQGSGPASVTNTNPDHVFEIHPVTRIEDVDLGPTLREVEGYEPYAGRKAFKHYLHIDCSISQTPNTISISTKRGLYNYADFWIKLNTTEKYEVEDGLFVYCTVLDKGFSPQGTEAPHLLHNKVRMAFVKDSAPYFQVSALREGDFMHVMGIPRINLTEISWRARRAANHPSDLKLDLPIEMIVVGILE